VSVSFVIESWAACAPGLDTREAWSAWVAAPWLPVGEPQAALAAVPPMLRRRFGPLGRIVAQSTFDLASQAADATPTVFASRYGEATRCLDLLADHARGDAMSPTAFGLSVHNAVGAMVAIAREDRSPSTAIAAGRSTAAAGVAEALGLLEEGALAASLIVYDAPLPGNYADFQDEPSAHFAWAWRLRRPRAGERALRVEWEADAGDAAPAPDPALAALPAGLQAFWFGLSGAAQMRQSADGQCCRWSRDV
jgi:hypothetical protein